MKRILVRIGGVLRSYDVASDDSDDPSSPQRPSQASVPQYSLLFLPLVPPQFVFGLLHLALEFGFRHCGGSLLFLRRHGCLLLQL